MRFYFLTFVFNIICYLIFNKHLHLITGLQNSWKCNAPLSGARTRWLTTAWEASVTQLPCQLTSYVTKGILSKTGIFNICRFLNSLYRQIPGNRAVTFLFNINSHSPFIIPKAVLVLPSRKKKIIALLWWNKSPYVFSIFVFWFLLIDWVFSLYWYFYWEDEGLLFNLKMRNK